MPESVFITLEGIDGCGKSTQLKLIVEYLRNNNITALPLREPGDTRLGEAVRSVLLGLTDSNILIDPKTEFLLFSAARSQFTREKLVPGLSNHEVIISDRFTDSSLAYQGFGHGVDTEFIRRINSDVTEGITPDLTLVFDIAPVRAFDRLEKRQDRIERYGVEFFERVRSGYLRIAEEEPERIKIIDADRSIDEVFNDVKSILSKLLFS